MSRETKHFYDFGGFRLDVQNRLLMRDGEVVSLPPKSFDILLALVEESGHVLTKDELMQRVWRDTFVEEANLSHHVFTLRKALGEEKNGNRYIETIPRRGYRFVAEVVEISDETVEVIARETSSIRFVAEEVTETDGMAAQTATAEATHTLPAQERVIAANSIAVWLKQHRLIVCLSVALVVALAAAVWFTPFTKRLASAPRTSMMITRITNSGKVGACSISPDGKFICYIQNNSSGNLYVRQVDTNHEIQLLKPGERVFGSTAFSSDGASIYYVLFNKNDPYTTLYRIPILGGIPTRLLGNCGAMFALSPDGERVTFYRTAADQKQMSLMIAALDGSSEQALLTYATTDHYFIGSPAWSSDGKRIAFALGDAKPDANPEAPVGIFGVEISSGESKNLTEERWDEVGKMAWTADGQTLIFVARRPHFSNQLYSFDRTTNQVSRLTNDLHSYGNYGLGITADASALVADVWESKSQLWLVGADGNMNHSRQLTLGEMDGRFGLAALADGRIAYVARTGMNYDIWTINEDGTNASSVTADDYTESDLTATPDGRYLVFASNRAGNSHLFRINVDGSDLQQLTFGETYDSAPDCSPDGRWIAFTSWQSGGKTTIWKVPTEGGERVQLTDYECRAPSYSPDGKMIACILPAEIQLGQGKLVVLSATDGELLKSFSVVQFDYAYPNPRWLPDGHVVIYRKIENQITNLWQQPLDGSPPQPLTDFKNDRVINYTLTADHKSLVLARGQAIVNVVVLKNFR